MEYTTVLDNEVIVRNYEMHKLFKKNNVFVLGYGSLLYSSGWVRSGIKKVTAPHNLKECYVKGYERGPFGIMFDSHFYGVIENKNCGFNGVLNKINSLHDWIALMVTECIYYGVPDIEYNYRVVDVTDKISGIKLPKNTVVHMVANEPDNRNRKDRVKPYPAYYERVWKGVQKERTPEFINEFLKTGGKDAEPASKDVEPAKRKGWYRPY